MGFAITTQRDRIDLDQPLAHVVVPEDVADAPSAVDILVPPLELLGEDHVHVLVDNHYWRLLAGLFVGYYFWPFSFSDLLLALYGWPWSTVLVVAAFHH
ncbi:hypothetical protein MA16_Dca011140 [Dendrobium catenatum]|uniref:Uncharacterized protein n=1 Tax=Dendrobium catenatum TaxID=906689 RepID=A0A2I0WSG7_9ASPA|nr:hypothetical protein MA16_Dca011140 [Dendrobium catenatum]